MTEPIKLAAFVCPELGKQRVDAQWARIAERRPLERKPAGRLVPAAGVIALAGALVYLWWPSAANPTVDSFWEGSVVASDDAPVDMTLPEGTHIKVDPRSEVKLLHSAADAVQVRLRHGSARFDVAKKRSRRFSVNLGQVEVVVTGTQFRVLRKPVATGERVQVEVLEGSVEVRRDEGGPVALRAGERWSTVVAGEPVERRGEAVEPANDEIDHNEDEGETSNVPSEVGDGELALDEDANDSDDGEASEESNDERAERASDSRRHARRKRAANKAAQDAEGLFDHANLARRAGRLDDAAELYDQLVSTHPSDRRAPLAAFELGRLRMDSLRDMRGAVRALERALKLAPQGTFAEDALARLVLAQEALHDKEACSRARTRYLARYPEGVHAQHVAERCSGS